MSDRIQAHHAMIAGEEVIVFPCHVYRKDFNPRRAKRKRATNIYPDAREPHDAGDVRVAIRTGRDHPRFTYVTIPRNAIGRPVIEPKIGVIDHEWGAIEGEIGGSTENAPTP